MVVCALFDNRVLSKREEGFLVKFSAGKMAVGDTTQAQNKTAAEVFVAISLRNITYYLFLNRNFNLLNPQI